MLDPAYLAKQIKEVETSDKAKFTVRLDMNMSLNKKEYIKFLISRHFMRDFIEKMLIENDVEVKNLDTRYFKEMFMRGVDTVVHQVTDATVKAALKDLISKQLGGDCGHDECKHD